MSFAHSEIWPLVSDCDRLFGTTAERRLLYFSKSKYLKALTGHCGVSFGSTELLLSHVFVGDRLHNIRSRDEQV